MTATRIDCDDEGLHLDKPGHIRWNVFWTSIRRVGWVVENTGVAITHDHFLALWDGCAAFLLSESCAGAAKAFDEIRRRFPPQMGPRGILSNVTWDDSVVVWPAKEAEQDFLQLCGQDLGRERIPVIYATGE